MDRSRIITSSNVVGFSVLLALGLYTFIKSRENSDEEASDEQAETSSSKPHNFDDGQKIGKISRGGEPDNKRNQQRAVQQSQRTNPGYLSDREAGTIVSLLSSATDDHVLCDVLTTVQNAAAFTTNQDTLREAGALPRLNSLLHAHNMALKVGQSVAYPAVVNGVITSINNMAINEHNQSQLKECIPTLIDFASTDKADESIQLASLQALTNLSVKPEYHEPYTKLIQQLYGYLDNGTHNIRVQAMRVLANLSTNDDMVPHLLAAKAPRCLFELLAADALPEILIRWTTILANVMCIVQDQGLSAGSLPTEYKAPSPETTFTALYGHNNVNTFKSKVFVLSRHHDSDVRHQASRIYGCLT